MRHKKLFSLLLALIMILPNVPVLAEDTPFPVVNVKNTYDISDSLNYFDEFDYSDPQHITDELLFGEWDEVNECWIPQYNSEVIKNNLQNYYPEVTDKPLINYDYDINLKAIESVVKSCDGNYDEPKAMLLEYYKNKFSALNVDITPSNSTLDCNALAYNYFTQDASLVKLFDMSPEETTYVMDITGNVSSVVNSTSTDKLNLTLNSMEIDRKTAYFYSSESEYVPYIIVGLSNGKTMKAYPTYDLTISGGQYASLNFPDDDTMRVSERENAEYATHDDNSAKGIMQFDFSFIPEGVLVETATLVISGYTDSADGMKKIALSTYSDINLVEPEKVTWSQFDKLGTSYSTSPGEMVTQYGFSGLSNSDILAKRYLYRDSEIYAYHAIRYLLSAHIEFDGNPFIFGSSTSPLLAQCGAAKLLASSVYALIDSDYMTPEAFGMLMKSVYHHAEWLVEGWEHGLLTNNHATYYNQGFSALVTLFPEFDKADDSIIYTSDPDENFYEGGKGGWIDCLRQRALVKVRDLTAADFSGKEASIAYNREAFRNAAAVMQNAIAADMTDLLPDEYYDKLAQAALYFVYGTAPGYYDWNTGDCYDAASNFIHGRPTIKVTIDALKTILENMEDKNSDYYKKRLEWYNHLTYAWYRGIEGEKPQFNSILYPFTRNLILRDGWENNAVGATMVNNNGNVHGHFDDLNVVVTAYGSELLADSGKPVYTRNDPTRAWQLSTRGHNTIEINDISQRGYMSNNWEIVKGPWEEDIILPFRDSHGVTNSEIETALGLDEPENAHIKEMVETRNYSDANLTAIYDMDDRYAIGEKDPENCNLQGRFLEAEFNDSYDYSKAETYSNINVEYVDDGDILGNGKGKYYKALDNAHNRSLLFIKNQQAPRFFIVTDYVAPVNGNKEVNKYAQGWHFRNDAKITVDETTNETRTHFSGANIAVVPIIGKDTETVAEIKTGLYTNGDHIPAEYVTYTKYSDKPTTFNTILLPMRAGENHQVETKLISVNGLEEADASAFSFKITDSYTGKVTDGTYYNMHHLEKKTYVDLGDYYFDGRMLYVDKHNGAYTAAIIADGTYLQNSVEEYLIKSDENISNLSVEWREDGIYLATTHTDEGEGEYVDFTKLSVLNFRNTERVYLNGESIAYKIDGNYICFDEKPVPDGEVSIIGDVNGDGEADFTDAIAVLKYDAGISTLTENQLFAADTNGDSEVDFVDAIQILKYDCGLITSFN